MQVWSCGQLAEVMAILNIYLAQHTFFPHLFSIVHPATKPAVTMTISNPVLKLSGTCSDWWKPQPQHGLSHWEGFTVGMLLSRRARWAAAGARRCPQLLTLAGVGWGMQQALLMTAFPLLCWGWGTSLRQLRDPTEPSLLEVSWRCPRPAQLSTLINIS